MNLSLSIGICSGVPAGGGGDQTVFGPFSPGTIQSVPAGSQAWMNPDNAKVEDGSFATVAAASPHALLATNFNPGIPSGKTILGIKLEIKKQEDTGASIADSTVRLTKDNGSNFVGDEKRDTMNPWPAVAAYTIYGGEADSWGITLTPAEANSSDCGFIIIPTAGAVTAKIDHFRVTYYTD